jgi:TPR repeat protein
MIQEVNQSINLFINQNLSRYKRKKFSWKKSLFKSSEVIAMTLMMASFQSSAMMGDKDEDEKGVGISKVGAYYEGKLGGGKINLRQAKRYTEQARDIGHKEAYSKAAKLIFAGVNDEGERISISETVSIAQSRNTMSAFSGDRRTDADVAETPERGLQRDGVGADQGYNTEGVKRGSIFTGVIRVTDGDMQKYLNMTYYKEITKLSDEAFLGKRDSLQALINFAEKGDHLAEANLSAMYAAGEGGLQKNEEIALRYSKRAFGWLMDETWKGNIYAQWGLGMIYEKGLGVQKDDRAAVRLYKLAAYQGQVVAQYRLGLKYLYGQGVVQDEQEAVMLFRLAAAQGYTAAQYTLGWMHAYGRGVAKDDRESVRLYKLAADQGHAAAQYSLGWMYAYGQEIFKDDQEAVKYYKLAADQGHAAGQYNLGLMYEKGRGVTKDDQEAVKYYKLAAAQGYAAAQYNLGLMYEGGQGIAKDDRAAAMLLRFAADQGYKYALYKLGEMYENGQGVAKDDQEAVRLYRLAAEQGYALGP